MLLRLAAASVLAAASLLAVAAPKLAPHPGPLGVKWGKSPADARSILQSRMTFVSETPSTPGNYHTIDQRWGGTFGEMPIADALLKFHDGEFFYLMVTLATAEAKSASKVWETAVEKMTKTYGPPLKRTHPPKLASAKAIPDHLPLGDAKAAVLPLLWNERTREDEERTYQLHDANIRTGLWDPFAGWRFPNGVTVQVFVHQQWTEGAKVAVLKPLWIFAKDDRMKVWRQKVHDEHWVPPRDF